VFLGGAVLGRAARKPVLLISEAWGGFRKHILLSESVLEWKIPISPKLDLDLQNPNSCPAVERRFRPNFRSRENNKLAQ
jgi:hypothetical protein